MRKVLMTGLAVFALSGCYHATVNTGITPGTRQIEQKWAMSFVAGLVPPETINAMSECGNAGVARVETQHSFLNLLVGGITGGIVTPMQITVTCGQGQEEQQQDQQLLGAADVELFKTLMKTGQPFLVDLSS